MDPTQSVVTGIGLGILVGVVGGMWLLLSLVNILKALHNNKPANSARISAILSLPVFLAGNTWAAIGFMPKLLNQTVEVYYLAATTFTVILINTIPCYKIILWAADHIDGAKR